MFLFLAAALTLVAVVLLVATLAGVAQRLLHRWRSTPRSQLRRHLEAMGNAAPLQLVDSPDADWEFRSPDDYNFYPIGAAGPRIFSASESSGFEQSPEGAALAAIHILYRLGPAPNPDLESVLDSQVIGDGVPTTRATLRGLLSSDEVARLREAGPFRGAYVGWTVIRYAPLEARVNLAGISSLEDRTAKWRMPVTLLWVDGDWKLVLRKSTPDDRLEMFEVDEFRPLDVNFLAAFSIQGIGD